MFIALKLNFFILISFFSIYISRLIKDLFTPKLNKRMEIKGRLSLSNSGYGSYLDMNYDGKIAVISYPKIRTVYVKELIKSHVLHVNREHIIRKPDNVTDSYLTFGEKTLISGNGIYLFILCSKGFINRTEGLILVYKRSINRRKEDNKEDYKLWQIIENQTANDLLCNDIAISSDGRTLITLLSSKTFTPYANEFNDKSYLQGSINIYTMPTTDNEFILQQTILASKLTSIEFGKYIDVSNDGNTIIVSGICNSVRFEDCNQNNMSKVFIFNKDNNEYSLSSMINIYMKITSYNLNSDYYKDCLLKISGDGENIVVSSEYHSNGETIVFYKCGLSWVKDKVFSPKLIGKNSLLKSIDISDNGNRIIIGYPTKLNGVITSGSVYVYTKTTKGYSNNLPDVYVLKNIVKSINFFDNNFGTKVAISGNGQSMICSSCFSFADTNSLYRTQEVSVLKC